MIWFDAIPADSSCINFSNGLSVKSVISDGQHFDEFTSRIYYDKSNSVFFRSTKFWIYIKRGKFCDRPFIIDNGVRKIDVDNIEEFCGFARLNSEGSTFSATIFL
jgi:hypothetical protein